MHGLYNDGRTARSHPLEVRLEDGALVFDADGGRRWLLTDLEAEIVDDRVRLVPLHGGDERLSLKLSDWQAVTSGSPAWAKSQRVRTVKLVGVLTAAAATLAVLVFVVVPAAAGPLARATPLAMERRMGESFEAQLGLAFKPCVGAPGQAALRELGTRLEGVAGSPFGIRVRAVEAPMANAFALPGGSVLVTDDLIAMTESPDELSAVIAHEAAHVQKRHVMQAVWRSFGFGLLLDAIVGGGSGAGQQAVLLFGSLTSLRFGREAEAEADAVGQDLLKELGLSTRGMAPFFRRLAAAEGGSNGAEVREILSSHPDSLRRAAFSEARATPGAAAFTAEEWSAIRSACEGGSDPLRRLRNWRDRF